MAQRSELRKVPPVTVAVMLSLIRDLIRHKWSANASLLAAVRQCNQAASNEEIRKLLHHILVADRYWLMLTIQKPFDPEVEMCIPGTFDDLTERYQRTEMEEMNWLSACHESDLDRVLKTPFLPGQETTVAQAILQICLHSHGHRSQCAATLRALGGTPPSTDFVIWLKDRPAPSWPMIQS
jgi:uncharacterized damage-inducible protein DinB